MRKNYESETKEQIVRLYLEQGRTIKRLSEEYDSMQEILKLRKELAEARKEVEFLKKAVAFLQRRSIRGLSIHPIVP